VDCQNFVTRNEPIMRNEPELITSVLGLWVLRNVLRREPTDEEIQAAPGIGQVLAEPFLDWWHAK
jgi:hypothetical protein